MEVTDVNHAQSTRQVEQGVEAFQRALATGWNILLMPPANPYRKVPFYEVLVIRSGRRQRVVDLATLRRVANRMSFGSLLCWIGFALYVAHDKKWSTARVPL
jgi:hypothetical protein